MTHVRLVRMTWNSLQILEFQKILGSDCRTKDSRKFWEMSNLRIFRGVLSKIYTTDVIFQKFEDMKCSKPIKILKISNYLLESKVRNNTIE